MQRAANGASMNRTPQTALHLTPEHWDRPHGRTIPIASGRLREQLANDRHGALPFGRRTAWACLVADPLPDGKRATSLVATDQFVNGLARPTEPLGNLLDADPSMDLQQNLRPSDLACIGIRTSNPLQDTKGTG
jgi:hypothetical protein